MLRSNLKLISLIIALEAFTPGAARACQISKAEDRIVYIGDSHSVGEFGVRLAANLKADSELGSSHIQRFAVNSSAANHWVSSSNAMMQKLHIAYYCDGDGQVTGRSVPNDFPQFNELMTPAPRGVVIALGTNDTVWNCKTADAKTQTKAVQKILGQIPHGVPCAWVGPTTQNDNGRVIQTCGDQATTNAFVDHLKAIVQSRCTFIDSRTFTEGVQPPHSLTDCTGSGNPLRPNNPDHVHFHGALATRWADCAGFEISRALRNSLATSPTSLTQKKSPSNH